LLRFLAQRLIQLVPLLFLVALIVFLIMHALPGDPVALMLQGAEGGVASVERLDELRAQLGLNDPLPLQFWHFLTAALVGDLGISVRFHEPVTGLILDRFGSTLLLATSGLAVAIIIGCPLGALGAVWRDSWVDVASMGLSYVGASMPVYWLGLVLILTFSFSLGWFPPAGGGDAASLVLPAMTLGVSASGLISRLVRANLIEVLGEDYIRTGRSKGLGEAAILWRHAAMNAMIPVVTVLGLQFGAMLAGTVVTETVFSRPGVGRLVVNAILWKDYPLVQGCVLFIAAVYLLVNLLVDVAYAWIDPRVGVSIKATS
jgi:peptide/nickel transport system permease protein/oligopeptide transport system permease protein